MKITKLFCQGCGYLVDIKMPACPDCGGKMEELSSNNLTTIGHYVDRKRDAIDYCIRLQKHGLDPADVKKKITAVFKTGLPKDKVRAALLEQGVDIDLVYHIMRKVREDRWERQKVEKRI